MYQLELTANMRLMLMHQRLTSLNLLSTALSARMLFLDCVEVFHTPTQSLGRFGILNLRGTQETRET